MQGWMFFLILAAIFIAKVISAGVAIFLAGLFLVAAVFFLATGDD